MAQAQQDTLSANMLTSRVGDLLANTIGQVNEAGLRTDIADRTELDIREAAGVINILTAEDIRAAGCRDLQEALMLLPSFMPGRDVDDVIGFSIRGQWSHEGKCQYLLNGMPLNEASYGTYSIGNRMPLENVQRIEVINGPGSVIHGGFAAVGVVNIITRNPSDGEELSVVTSAAIRKGVTSDQHTHLFGSHRIGSTTDLSYSASLASGRRVIGQVTLPGDGIIDFSDSTHVSTLNGFFSIRRKNFRGQFHVFDQNLQVSDMPYDLVLRTVMGSGAFNLRLGTKSRLGLEVIRRTQLPWFYGNGASLAQAEQNTVDERTQLNADLQCKPVKWLSLSTGLHGYWDRFMMQKTAPGVVLNVNDRPVLDVLDGALYGEARVRSAYGSLIAGFRGEYQSLSGWTSAPRFAYTIMGKKAHFKAMYSASYKLPTMQNVNVGPEEGIRPELLWTREAEVGYRIGPQFQFTICAFHTRIDAPIVYVYQGDTIVQDSYVNRGASSTYGVEGTIRHIARDHGVIASFSLYQVDQEHTDLPETALPSAGRIGFHGIPRMKWTVSSHWNISDHTRFGGQLIWSDRSWSYGNIDADSDVPSLVEFPAWLKASAHVEHRFARVEELTLTAGCKNLLNVDHWIQSPYDNGLMPLPQGGREYFLTLRYRFSL